MEKEIGYGKDLLFCSFLLRSSTARVDSLSKTEDSKRERRDRHGGDNDEGN